ncbi:MAG: preprotein translocase subunit SecG [Cellvibrionaceae bacterium]|nr:preprotein translocase subunit SecG [Cellvibrionaceae bacterium]
METIVIIIHMIIALAMAALILIQQGKGADAGASFGSGASQTVFGSQGGSSFFAKLTAVLAVIFFATSFSLTIIAKNKSEVGIVDDAIPVVEEVIGAATPADDIPVVDADPLPASDDVPVVDNIPAVDEQ